MLFRKKCKELYNQISSEKTYIEDSKHNVVINIKAETEEKIFSEYNYDSNDKLNSELDAFIVEKMAFVPAQKDVRLKLYTNPEVNSKDVELAIRNNYKKKYIGTKQELFRNAVFSGIILCVGLLCFALFFLMHAYFYNVYVEAVMEVATWVFTWESLVSFCIRRPEIRRRKIIYLKLFAAEIKIVKLKTLGE